MRYITDWHVHSKYSRACSKDLELPKIAEWCERKGINIVATGDWTHPKWFAHLEENLEEVREGIYRVKGVRGKGRGVRETEFMLVTEVSQIYKKGEQTRRIHNLIWSPSLEICRRVNEALAARGLNLKSDGRPILGIDSEALYKLLREIDERIIVVPAHAWTPWYAIFGSKSGFNSIEECFGEMSKYIYAIETGLSSDPKMNWQLSALDKVVLISNSDAHSPKNLAREANVFEFERPPTYSDFVRVLREQDRNAFKYTVEFYPEEGKYHADGCASDAFCCSPEESLKLGDRCPKCKKKLVLGVQHRIDELADRSVDVVADRKIPFKSIIPLAEILSEIYGVSSTSSKKVQAEYFNLTDQIDELTLLLDTPIETIVSISSEPTLGEAIRRMRAGEVFKQPGYDGVYGKITVFGESLQKKNKQSTVK
ncbi:MAG: endonuclease Q family protein [Candidatus Uhrbacteria bacterium]|nr:endonuclease Q family protein [Candidatus Uhrbacteria bacterium]